MGVILESEEHRPEAQGFETNEVLAAMIRMSVVRGTPPRGAGV